MRKKSQGGRADADEQRAGGAGAGSRQALLNDRRGRRCRASLHACPEQNPLACSERLRSCTETKRFLVVGSLGQMVTSTTLDIARSRIRLLLFARRLPTVPCCTSPGGWLDGASAEANASALGHRVPRCDGGGAESASRIGVEARTLEPCPTLEPALGSAGSGMDCISRSVQRPAVLLQ